MGKLEISGDVAIVGVGNMGEAILAGLLRAGIPPQRIRASEPRTDHLERIQDQYHVATTTSNADAVFEAKVVFLCVKPHQAEAVLTEIAAALSPSTLILSIVTGLSLDTMAHLLPAGTPTVRVMPNTAVKVGAGTLVMSPGRHVGPELQELTHQILSAFGKAFTLPEEQQNMMVAISGSGIAYVYLMAEALVDAGVQLGLGRPLATEMVAQTVAGAGAMLSQPLAHPTVLREQVTSPGGTTAVGVATLESFALRAAVNSAVQACFDKASELSKG